MVMFQTPGVGEAQLQRDVAATFRGLMRRPAMTLAEFRCTDPRLQALPMTLFVGEPALMGEPIMSEDDLSAYIAAFEKNRFRRRTELVSQSRNQLARHPVEQRQGQCPIVD